jgi:hypothetical protein
MSKATPAELAALAGSLEDERFDPGRILAAARAEFAGLAGTRRGSEIEALQTRFGTHQIDPLLQLRPWSNGRPLRRFLETLVESPPEVAAGEHVFVSLRPRARLSLFDFSPPTAAKPAEAGVAVSVKAQSWTGPIRPTRLSALLSNAAAGSIDILPRSRSRLLRALWVFALGPRDGGWRFIRFERRASARHRRVGVPAVEHRQMRDEVLFAMAKADSLGTRIPLEVAGSLPDDPGAAVLDLALLDHAFSPDVIEAALRRLVGCWAAASEGAPDALVSMADPTASAALLDPPGYVLRAAELEQVDILRVRALRIPPELTVKIAVRGWHGPADLTDLREEGVRRLRPYWWRLARQEAAEQPWRLVDARVDPVKL